MYILFALAIFWFELVFTSFDFAFCRLKSSMSFLEEMSVYQNDFSQYPPGIAPTVLKVEGNIKNNLEGNKTVFEEALQEMKKLGEFTKTVKKVILFWTILLF